MKWIIGNVINNLNGIKPQTLPKVNYHQSYIAETSQRVPGGQESGQNVKKNKNILHNEPVGERQLSHDLTPMWNLMNKIN